MKKAIIQLFIVTLIAISAVGCHKETPKQDDPFVSIKGISDNSIVLAAGDQTSFELDLNRVSDLSITPKLSGYKVAIDEKSKVITIDTDLKAQPAEFTIKGMDKEGKPYISPKITLSPTFIHDRAMLVVNEGSAWHKPTPEMGSLIYVTPSFKGYENIYSAFNGRPLGNVSQDLCINNGKIYVVSQTINPKTDGLITVIDGTTMQKIANYSDELSDIKPNWPTHIAVLDDQHVLVRDGSGLFWFDTTTKKATRVEKTSGARKNTMPVVNHKIFVTKGKTVLVMEAVQTLPTNQIEFEGAVSGIVPMDKNYIYVAEKKKKAASAKIHKVNTTTLKVEQSNEISDPENLLDASFPAAPSITAKGDTIYYSGVGTKVYRHIFSKNDTKMMIDVKPLWPEGETTYNTCAVHPITGLVYINRIAGWDPKHAINKMMELDLKGDNGKYVRSLDNLTRYPAGIFFPHNFRY